jgi:broad specificity phosphatase PhoE
MKTRKQKEIHFKMYFIRHGVSCGNINFALKDELALGVYTDPELTREGRRILNVVQDTLVHNIDGPYIVGASNLIRAQQTANLLFNPKKIYIIPAISEFGRNNQENMPLRPSVQEEIFKQITHDADIIKKRDYRFFKEDPSMTDTNQIQMFLTWLGNTYRSLAKASKHKHPNLVFVSHYGFIKELVESVIKLYDKFIPNTGLFEFRCTLRGNTVSLDYVNQIIYTDIYLGIKDTINTYLKTDRCRIPLRKQGRRTKTYKKGE